jgi:hypothetical protein
VNSNERNKNITYKNEIEKITIDGSKESMKE